MAFDTIRYMMYRRRYDIDRGFEFRGKDIRFLGEGEIRCGKGSYIGSYGEVAAVEGRHIYIGKRVAISFNVRMFTRTWESDQDMSRPIRELVDGDIEIGDFCWIGVNTYIGPGVHIGQNTTIGANSVVTKDVPPDCIAAGSPLKIIHEKSYATKKKAIESSEGKK